MPTFIDFHSMGKYTEDDLKRGQNERRDEFGVKVLNIFYDMDSGMIFCLVDALIDTQWRIIIRSSG
jgi:hypothetical protein